MVASALRAIKARRSRLKSHNAQQSQRAAGASVNTPADEIRLNARRGTATTTRARVHRLHDIAVMPRAATSQSPATHLDVTQSQVTTEDALDVEHPHGREAITKTEPRAATRPSAANPRAMNLVFRSVSRRETATGQVYVGPENGRRAAHPALGLRRRNATSASAVETRSRRKFLNAKRSHAVSAADRLPSASYRYQCIHSWQYRKRSTSRRSRNDTVSDAQANRIPSPRLRRAAKTTGSLNGRNGTGTCSTIRRSSNSQRAARCGRVR